VADDHVTISVKQTVNASFKKE